jgi:hypothetical protein
VLGVHERDALDDADEREHGAGCGQPSTSRTTASRNTNNRGDHGTASETTWAKSSDD